ncbi:EKC/KEOPS complex subunit bud32 [Halyomorpha halys]|uniref:EKC/KEOPS complex subunit bud32 n=1 Tax=Halyomorpha halys TaxID=286706 RepID=UPI0006D511CC|nr:EKC/KEOPS complex subunit bud32 [Halyomorpha halys]
MEILGMIEQGAEARVFNVKYLGKAAVLKERYKRKYRNPILDEHILTDRVRAEARGLLRSKIAGVRVPAVYMVDLDTGRLCLEAINGITAKKFIDRELEERGVLDNDSLLHVMELCGRSIGKLHSDNIIHGDLTTSNVIVSEKNNPVEVSFIDFGLSYVSTSAEDKGVDLYVLERALTSTHSSADILFKEILVSYKQTYQSGAKEVLHKFEEVKARGRKRTMVG